MDTFLQSPRTMVNAVFAEAAKEQQSVTTAAVAAAAVTASLQQEASSSPTTPTTTNNSTNLDTTTNPFNIDTNQTGNGAADNASVATDSSSSKRAKNSSNNNNSQTNAIDKVDNFRARIDSLWKNAKTEDELENAFKKTMHLATKQTENLIREGRAAFHLLETLTRSHALLQDELESKKVELQRLQAAEEKSRSYIKNLIRVVEASKVEVRDSSRSALNEAALRAELAIVATKKNEALGVAEEYKRKASLLEQEVGQVKMKLLRATQDRAKMERDQRAALSLAKSMKQYHSGSAALSSSGADMEYYKRKVTELNGRLQGMTGVLAEKERQSNGLRSQIERSMSKNRLAELRASKKTTTGGRKRPL